MLAFLDLRELRNSSKNEMDTSRGGKHFAPEYIKFWFSFNKVEHRGTLMTWVVLESELEVEFFDQTWFSMNKIFGTIF